MYRRFQFLFALLTIISMQSVYAKMLFTPSLDMLMFGSNSIVLVLLILMRKDKLYLNKVTIKRMLAIILAMILLLTYRIIFFKNSINLSSSIIVTILFTFFLSMVLLYFDIDQLNLKYFFADILKVVVFLAGMSLFFFFFGQTLRLLPQLPRVRIDWGGIKSINNWFFLHFDAQGDWYKGFANGRNTGIYSEAPQFAFVLCLGLAIEMFLKKRTNYLSASLIAVAVYTTLSTTGQIILLLIILLKLVTIQSKSKWFDLSKKVGIGVSGLVVAYLVRDIYVEKMGFGESYRIREINSSNAWNNFFKNPIFGIGFKSDELGLSTGNTSTFTQVLQEGGLLFVLVYFSGTVRILLTSFFNKNFDMLFFVGCYVLLLYPTVMTYTQLSVTLVASMYALSVYNLNDDDVVYID